MNSSVEAAYGVSGPVPSGEHTGAYMTLAIIGIGLAGAGKSTALKHLAHLHNLVYISRDEIAYARWGHPHDQEHRDEVGQKADQDTEEALQQGRSVVLDSTFVCRQKRCAKIQFLREKGATRVVGVFFDTPYRLAAARNVSRRFVVPADVLEEQQRKLERDPPTLTDGFDHLYRSEEIDKLRRMEFI